MSSPARRIHLVRHLDDGTQDVSVQMQICTGLTANLGKDRKIFALRTNQRISLKMRHYSPCQIRNRSGFVLVRPIRSRISNSPASKILVKLFQQLQVSLIERDRKRRSRLNADLQLLAETERHRETTFAFHEPSNEPGVQHCALCDLHKNLLPSFSKKGTSDRRIAQCRLFDIAPLLSDQSLRGQYVSSPDHRLGVNSYDFPRDCPLLPQEGFPDMSRFTTRLHKRAGQLIYPTRNFATLGPLYLRPPFTRASITSFVRERTNLIN